MYFKKLHLHLESESESDNSLPIYFSILTHKFELTKGISHKRN